MELRHLRYFVAVAEELNFARAAARLRIAAPALSVQIRKLEEEIGTALLARAGRGSKLTDAGRVFLEQSRKCIADGDRAIALARQAAQGEIGHLSIGYNTPSEFEIFPRVIPAFKKRSPNVHLAFFDLKTAQILDGLRRKELDLGFVWLPIPTDELDVRPLTQEPLVAVIPASHRLASAASVSVKDLSREPLIMFRSALEPFTFHQIEELFVQAGATMNVAYELDTSPQMVNFVAMGLGCSLLPDYARAMRRDGVVYKKLRRPTIVKTLAIVKNKGEPGLADVFFRFTVANLTSARGFG